MFRFFASPSVAWLLVVVCLFIPSRAAADGNQRCPTIDGAAASLGEIDAQRRLAFVRDVMDDQARRARRWSLIWAVTGLGLAAGNYTQAALADTRDDRIDPIVGGSTSLVIPAAILIQPLEVMRHQRTLEQDLATLSPAEGIAGLCAALARAERLFVESADNEAFSAGIFTHAFVIAGNGAVALFLGLGFDHWKGALINGGGGLLISEIQIFTQPTGAVTDLARYRHGDLGSAPAKSAIESVRLIPWVANGGAGVTAVGFF